MLAKRNCAVELEHLELRRLLSGNPAANVAVGCPPLLNRPISATPVPRAAAATGSLVVPQLSSNPGAPVTIYLDFDGDGAGIWGGYNVTSTPAFDSDNDPSNFDAFELDQIRKMWKLVVDAYSPFDVNVTTIDPGTLIDGRSVRAVVGGDGAWTGSVYGGLSYVGSFLDSLPNTVWVFSDYTGKGAPDHAGWTARVISHEVGHSFGLWHQSIVSTTGVTQTEYDPGTTLTSPIMGYSYSGQRATWRTGRNNFGQSQDDVSTLLAGGVSLIGDDVPAGQSRPLTLNSASPVTGRIETAGDTDVYSFTLTAPRIVNLRVDPPVLGAHATGTLDAAMRLTGNGVDRDLDTFNLGESLSVRLGAGTYTVQVRAGASNLGYANLGSYAVSLNAVDAIAALDMNDSRMRVTWSAVPSAGVYLVRASTVTDPFQTIFDLVSPTGAATQSRDYTYFATGAEVVVEAYAGTTNFGTPIARYGALRGDMHELNSNPFRTSAPGDTVEAEDFIAQYVSNTPITAPVAIFEDRTIDLTQDNLGNAQRYRPTAVDLDFSTDPTRPGIVVTRTQPGEELAYSITNDAAGTYVIEARVSNPQPGASVVLRLDGGTSSFVSSTVAIPATGAWSSYTTIRSAPFALAAGVAGFFQRLKVKFLATSAAGSVGNFDSFRLVRVIVPQPPAAPTNLVATFDPAAGAVRLRWDDNSNNEAEFVVQRRLRGQGSTSWAYATRANANVNTAIDSQITFDSAYEYRVLANNDAGTSVSNIASVQTTRPQTPPVAPTNLRVAYDRTANVVRLSWQDNSNNESNFIIQRRFRGQNDSAWQAVVTGDANTTSGTDSSVIRNVVYEYRVLASNAAGAAASVAVQLPVSAINPPSGLRALGPPAAGNVVLGWNDNSSNETGFEIERRLAGGTWSKIGTAVSSVVTFRDATANPNARYEYRVRAINTVDWVPSDYSNVLSVWTLITNHTAGT